jgi:hypothetical protein
MPTVRAFVDARPGVEMVGFVVLALIADEAIEPADVGEGFDTRVFVLVGVAELKKTAQL